MRAFDNIDDVKQYLNDQRNRAEEKVGRIVATPTPAGWKDRVKRAEQLGTHRGAYSAYTDAMQALGEIRPGLIEAFQNGVTLRPMWSDSVVDELVSSAEKLAAGLVALTSDPSKALEERQKLGIAVYTELQRTEARLAERLAELPDTVEATWAKAKVAKIIDTLLRELFGVDPETV